MEKNETDESAATDMRFGIAYQKGKYDNFAIEYRFGFDEYSLDRIFLGAEHSIYNTLILRSGYSRNLLSEHDNINEKYAVGLAVKVDKFVTNFSYEFNHLENFYLVGLDINL